MRDAIATNAPMALTLGGLLIGFLFGAIVFRTNFCTMGALSDIVNMGDWRRFRAWLLAIAVAMLGFAFLARSGVIDPARSMYLAPRLTWLGNIFGGLLFGYGMVFAGGCASRNLARAGGGDLRSLMTLIVLGIFAYAAIGGIFGPARNALETATSISVATKTQGLPDLLSGATGMSSATLSTAIAALLSALLLVYCFMDVEFRGSPMHVISGIGVGLAVVAGWALTGLAFDELAEKPTALASVTFVRPVGDTLEWLQRYTAIGLPGFGVASVIGTLLGAAAAAVAMGRFRIATFSDARDATRNLGGAVLMGIGGIMALGCTMGQGVTGVSTLAVGSFLALFGIMAGGVIGLKHYERIISAEA